MFRIGVIALFICAALTISSGCLAQDASATAAQNAAGATLSPEQLDQLVAPVALYPDPLLADVLTASTYPLEVVEADRWVEEPGNEELTGAALADEMNARNWDASIQSLVPFPDVLQLMDGHLDWMEELGEAFLAQPDAVLDAVQRMRGRAAGVGNLSSNSEETVADEDGEFDISVPPSGMIYVPEYDPWCAFGDWPYPPFPPYYFSPWPGSCESAEAAVEFAPAIAWPFAWWDWGYFDWRHHRILIHQDRYDRFHHGREAKGKQPKNNQGDNKLVGNKHPATEQTIDTVWHHDVSHRADVPYRNPRNTQAFGPPPGERPSLRSDEISNESVESARPAPPAFESFAPQPVVRMQSMRGMSSRQGFPGSFGHGFGGAMRGGASPPPGRH